jgi:hypothetical protein
MRVKEWWLVMRPRKSSVELKLVAEIRRQLNVMYARNVHTGARYRRSDGPTDGIAEMICSKEEDVRWELYGYRELNR